MFFAFVGVISNNRAPATNLLIYALNTWLVANARLVGDNSNDGRNLKSAIITAFVGVISTNRAPATIQLPYALITRRTRWRNSNEYGIIIDRDSRFTY